MRARGGGSSPERNQRIGTPQCQDENGWGRDGDQSCRMQGRIKSDPDLTH